MNKVVKEFPPNYERIIQYFPVKNKKNIIFTYGNKIYNPSNGYIPEHLMRHEETHTKQQKEHPGGVNGWWEQYYRDAKFRFAQELEAYRNQYQYVKETESREFRRMILNNISKDLSSEIYGRLTTKKIARKLIKGET